jgi:lipopolysaccharide export system permease protein
MRLIDRYLLRELAAALFAVGAVLLLILLGGTLTATLDRIARGVVPAALLLSQVGLRSIDALPILMPLALFLAVLLAYGRLYRDSEMAVLAASGYDARALARPLLAIALPLIFALGLVAFWGGPAAVAASDRMIDAANRSLLVAGMEPGRFVELPGREAVVYVAEMASDGRSFTRLFVHDERDGRVDVVTSARGELFQDRAGTERYLALEDGFRVEGKPGELDWRTMRFQRNAIRLPEVARDAARKPEKRRGSLELLRSADLLDLAEFHWRLGLPLSAGVLALIAMPLARSQPREPRYGKLLIAVLAYVLYTNLMTLGRGWIADGSLPAALGLWWVHVLALCGGLWLFGADARRMRRARA